MQIGCLDTQGLGVLVFSISVAIANLANRKSQWKKRCLKVKVDKELSANSLQSPDTCTPWHLRPVRKGTAGAGVIWKQPSERITKSCIRATLSI
jgi:hypothetical protein